MTCTESRTSLMPWGLEFWPTFVLNMDEPIIRSRNLESKTNLKNLTGNHHKNVQLQFELVTFQSSGLPATYRLQATPQTHKTACEDEKNKKG